MRAHPAGGLAEDASARVMTAGFAFPMVYPLLAALQACMDINASTTLRHDNGNQQRISTRYWCLHFPASDRGKRGPAGVTCP